MSQRNINLTAAEWDVMECLWEKAPLTGRAVTEAMHKKCGWNRSTTLTLLSRLEAKGAVSGDATEGKKLFRPLLLREDAALQETEDFLGRVYKGSVHLMVSAMTRKQSLSQEEIDELFELLKGMEGKQND